MGSLTRLTLAAELADRHPLALGSAGWAGLSPKTCGALLDRFVERGGSVLDTARVYADGRAEAAIGAWLQQRRRSADILVVTKGGHPDAAGRQRLSATDITGDIELSLNALGLDYVDVYLLHRDDRRVPVEHLCEALLAVQRRGLARYIGVSNWVATRVHDAQACVGDQALGGLAAVSNYFGLAVPPPLPVLPGAASAFDRALLFDPDGAVLLGWGALTGGYFARETPDRGDSYWNTQGNALRRSALRRTAADADASATAVLVRWLSKLPRLRPVVGTTSQSHLDDMMAAAQDTSLDSAVDALMTRCAAGTDPDAGRFLLPSRRVAAW